MSKDDAPKDGEVTSFRARRRTRRGKRRSLRVPVDEVPRRSAADEVPNATSEAPMPLHAQGSSFPPPANTTSSAAPPPAMSSAPPEAFGDEPTVPGSVPAPFDEDDYYEATAPSDDAPVNGGPPPGSEVPPPPGLPRDLAIPPPSQPPPAPSSPPPASTGGSPSAAPPGAPSRPPSSAPSYIPSAPPSAPPPSASPSYIPSAPPGARSRPPPPRRDSVIVRGTVRVAGSPATVPEPAEPAAAFEPAPPSEPPPGMGAEERTSPEPIRALPEIAETGAAAEEESLVSVEAAIEARSESEVAEPVDTTDETEAPPAEALDQEEGEGDEDLDIELADDDAAETELPGEPTLAGETVEHDGERAPPPAARADAKDAAADDGAEITIEEASDDDLAAYGFDDEELEVELEDEPEEERASAKASQPDDDEPEELDLAEEDAVEEIALDKPRSQPPPTPTDATEGTAVAGDASGKSSTDGDKASAGAPPPPPQGETTQRPAEQASAAEAKPRRRRKPWWEDFFNDDYLRTVRPYPERYIKRQCDYIEASLRLERGATILDVGCGLGLHAVELTSRGYLVVGLDLSLPMLSRAADEAQDRGLKINFLHGDMREMTFDGAFDAVLCWGTTLGYFDEDTNRKVIERLYRALKPMGLLLLDVVNRDHVIRSQPNLVWFEGDGCVCMEETQFNYITSRLEVKRTVILDDGRQRENVYSIRLYSLSELGRFMHEQGFRVAQVSGHEAHPGVFFGADSPKMIIMAERRLTPTQKDTPKESPRDKPPPPPASTKAAGEGGDGQAKVAADEDAVDVDAELEPDDDGEGGSA